jgi:predicted transcriptional regulator
VLYVPSTSAHVALISLCFLAASAWIFTRALRNSTSLLIVVTEDGFQRLKKGYAIKLRGTLLLTHG